MHFSIKHFKKCIGNSLLLIFFVLFSFEVNSEQSAEEIVKARKALFSKNYNTAKKITSLASDGEFDQAKQLILEMSENYKTLLNLFPDNTRDVFKTEALPTIWENKDDFNVLTNKASSDMIELASLIETTDDMNITLETFMWGNCKSCHSKFRIPQ